MNDTLLLLAFGGCLGTVAANIMVMLLVYLRLSRQPKRVHRVPRVGENELDNVIEAWTSGGFRYLAMRQTAEGVYTIWFQEK